MPAGVLQPSLALQPESFQTLDLSSRHRVTILCEVEIEHTVVEVLAITDDR